jgi:hypothetical protein
MASGIIDDVVAPSAAIRSRAARDDEFRERLVADPEPAVNEVLASLGLGPIPDGVRIRVVEDSADEIYLVLPARASRPAPTNRTEDAACTTIDSLPGPDGDATDVADGCTTPTATVGCADTGQEQCTTPTYSEVSCPGNTQGGCETDACESDACQTDDGCDDPLADERRGRRLELSLF